MDGRANYFYYDYFSHIAILTKKQHSGESSAQGTFNNNLNQLSPLLQTITYESIALLLTHWYAFTVMTTIRYGICNGYCVSLHVLGSTVTKNYIYFFILFQ